MRTIKTAFGIALLLLAVLISVGVLSEYFAPAENRRPVTAESAWAVYATAILFGGICLCGAYLLLRPAANDLAEIRCIQCGAHGNHARVPSLKDRSGSRLARHLGGPLLSVFYAGGREERFQCGQCGELFYSHTAVSKVYRLLFILFAAIILIRAYFELYGG
jgi:hypothetical protein